MEVFALVGQSGTGKSHRALLIASENRITAIIDDGLLISGGQILAGKSAKKSSSKISAIRTALFMDEDHAQEVSSKLMEINPPRVLILGTSNGMVQKIAKRLNLQAPSKYIYIEDVSSKEEIDIARFKRQRMGTHVVPAPSMEVKQKLSVTLVDAFFHKKHLRARHPHSLENSIVRPTYNTYGHFYIASQAVEQIVRFACVSNENIVKISKVEIVNIDRGMLLNIDLELILGKFIPQVATDVRKVVKKYVEEMTAIIVAQVNVNVKKLHVTSPTKG